MAGLSLSDFLGYTSITCWLGAQLPQVVENIRNQSCEGLALPFLANWLLGDFSNLIGCILTHQLPFQTYLATYFCFVDCVLVAQYFYYPNELIKPHTHPRRSSANTRGMSYERGVPRYRTLSTVAANVAAAAAFAAQQEEQTEPVYVHTRWSRQSTDQLHDGLGCGTSRDEEDVDEDALMALADSFHSEGGQTSGRKRVSWSRERYGQRGGSLGRGQMSPMLHHSLQITTSPLATFDPQDRGRSLQRDVDEVENAEAGSWRQASETPTIKRTSSRASRRSAGMVFLGVWALFGIGTLTGGNRGSLINVSPNIGRVVSSQATTPLVPFPSNPVTLGNIPVPATFKPAFSVVSAYKDDDPSREPNDEEPSSERAIGRIFAWLCTTLYLTSRLPQIWKNYARKSVEGLSMYLFVFAFLGNVFYVASIVSSPRVSLPPPASSDFIKESIPYLLGSGGTLLFDITIVTQSFVYRPRSHHRGRRNSTRSRALDGEEAGLLDGDALVHETATSDSAIPQSRSRTVTT